MEKEIDSRATIENLLAYTRALEDDLRDKEHRLNNLRAGLPEGFTGWDYV